MRTALEDNLQALVKAVTALGIVEPIALVDLGEGGTSDTEVQSAVTQVIKGGNPLSDLDWVTQRQYVHCQPNFDLLGAGGHGHGR